MGYRTPAGLVPIVPAAVVYDLAEGDPRARPDADSGYAACEAAAPGVPERGRVGAGTGAAVGKILGRERSTRAGIGFAAARSGAGETVAALAVVNAFGDVIGEDGQVLGGCRTDGDEPVRTAERIAAMKGQPDWTRLEERNTTLVCVMTDATLDKAACTRVARMASGGVARAVDPVFSDVDGDVVFCLSSGSGATDRFTPIAIGTIAATVTAAAIRDSIQPLAEAVNRPTRRSSFPAHAGQLQDRGDRSAKHSLRRGRSDPPPLQRHAGADQRDREGVAAAALAVRRAAGAVLPARPRAPRGARRPGDGDVGGDGRGPPGPALQRPGADGRARGAATRCFACATPRSRTRPRTTCCAATSRCSTARSRPAESRRSRWWMGPPARRRRWRSGSSWRSRPASAPSSRPVLAAVSRTGSSGSPGRQAESSARSCERGGFELSPKAHQFMVEALGQPLAAAPSASERDLRQVERAISETLEHHAHVQLRAAA